MRFSAGTHLAGDGLVGTRAIHRAGKQMGLRPHPAVILAQRPEQIGTERHVTIFAALALADVDEHALAVDVFDLEVAHLGSPHTGRVERHEHGPVEEVAGRVDQRNRLVLAQDDGQASRPFRIRELVQLVGPLESLYEEEAECRSLVADRAGFQLALFDQMRLILPDFVQAELIGRLVEVVGKVADDRQYDCAVFLE